MDGLFSGQLAQAAPAAMVVKALISGLKFLTPQIGTPSTFSPLHLRVAALVAGVFCGVAMHLGPLTLPPESSAVFVYGNWILGGVLIGVGALGTHETVDMVKPQ